MEPIKQILDNQNVVVHLQDRKIEIEDKRIYNLVHFIDSDKRNNAFYQQVIDELVREIDFLYQKEPPVFTGIVVDSQEKALPDYKSVCQNRWNVTSPKNQNRLQDLLMYMSPNSECTSQEDQIEEAIYTLEKIQRQVTRSDRRLAENLFRYIGTILENYPDITLRKETITRLFNTNPELFPFSVDEIYDDRMLDYVSLAAIMNQNKTLEKSGFTTEDILKLLIDTYQVRNEKIWREFLTPEQLQTSHQTIDEFLSHCNAKMFVHISNIITRNFDANYDRYTLIKEHSKDNKAFPTAVLKELSHVAETEADYQLMKRLLTDDEIQIDWNLSHRDYFSETDINLKTDLALTRNPKILSILLQDSNRIHTYYSYDEAIYISLFEIYAILGDYKKSIQTFEEKFHDNQNYASYVDNPQKKLQKGIPIVIPPYFQDVFTQYIETLVKSFEDREINENKRKEILSRVFNSKTITYINPAEVLEEIEPTLSKETFQELVTRLREREQNGEIRFVTREEYGLDQIIRTIKEDEVERVFSEFQPKKTFTYTPKNN